jgi:hypothetical protein
MTIASVAECRSFDLPEIRQWSGNGAFLAASASDVVA